MLRYRILKGLDLIVARCYGRFDESRESLLLSCVACDELNWMISDATLPL
jgi:hypothetical protein